MVSYLDNTHSPTANLIFKDGLINDISGNGNSVSLTSGDFRVGEIVPGMTGLAFDGDRLFFSSTNGDALLWALDPDTGAVLEGFFNVPHSSVLV